MRQIQQESKAQFEETGNDSHLRSLKIKNFEKATLQQVNDTSMVNESKTGESESDDDLDETDPNMAPSIE